jgi:hypothetical protein
MNKKLRLLRILTAIGLGALIAAVVFVLIFNPTENFMGECFYRRYLHLKCSTCGATRAVYYFFTLRFGKAFYYHAYFTVLSPVMAYVALAFCVNVFCGKRVLPLRLRWWWAVVFIGGLIAFGILRNFTAVIY